MKKKILVFVLLGLFISCTSRMPSDTITQYATIDALLAGVYDGEMSCQELLKHGDLGIGTFNSLDGEMILLNGKMYQAAYSGEVNQISGDRLTPFATVCSFRPEKQLEINAILTLDSLQNYLDNHLENLNVFYAIKVSGKFSQMKMRSVPAQVKPYSPLSEVAKKQSVFQYQDISGTIVGFRCPVFVKGINVPGYHLHFISDDFTKGGHILHFEIHSGIIEIDACHRFSLILPKNGETIKNVNFSIDRSKELEEIEK